MLVVDTIMLSPFATTFNESCSNLIPLRVVVHRKYAKLVDLDRALEARDHARHLRPPKSFLVCAGDAIIIVNRVRLVTKRLDVFAIEAVIWTHHSADLRCPLQNDGARLATLRVRGKVFNVWEQYRP